MAEPLRVLQLIDSLARAGAEQSLVALAPHLVRQNIELHVGYLIERQGLRTNLEQAGIPVHSLAGSPAGRRRWLERTSALVGTVQPDVVHTTLFEADLAGRRAAARARVPCVSSFVNTAYGRTESSRDGLRSLRLRAAQVADAATARRVTRFHAVTQHVAQVMSRRLLVPMSKIEVIPRGRDPEDLGRRTPARRAETRRRLGVSDETPVILAVGRQEPQKGFDLLLRALPEVWRHRSDVRVMIAGREGRASGALTTLGRELGVADQVTFLGMRNDVPDLLAAADVLAFPSLWEGAAGTLIEAMALECPIVTARLPTIVETADEAIAVHVEPDDPSDLARGLLNVLSDPGGATGRAKVGRTRFERTYTIEVCAKRMADLYSRVAASAA
jgi:glycosyltransferase involved in cell wall biosynthesis